MLTHINIYFTYTQLYCVYGHVLSGTFYEGGHYPERARGFLPFSLMYLFLYCIIYSDPYMRIHVGDQVKDAIKTTVKNKTLEPVWEAEILKRRRYREVI